MHKKHITINLIASGLLLAISFTLEFLAIYFFVMATALDYEHIRVSMFFANILGILLIVVSARRLFSVGNIFLIERKKKTFTKIIDKGLEPSNMEMMPVSNRLIDAVIVNYNTGVISPVIIHCVNRADNKFARDYIVEDKEELSEAMVQVWETEPRLKQMSNNCPKLSSKVVYILCEAHLSMKYAASFISASDYYGLFINGYKFEAPKEMMRDLP